MSSRPIGGAAVVTGWAAVRAWGAVACLLLALAMAVIALLGGRRGK
ncbi:MAG: hypothetical protein ACRD17_14485 [Terriglobales bacterium]